MKSFRDFIKFLLEDGEEDPGNGEGELGEYENSEELETHSHQNIKANPRGVGKGKAKRARANLQNTRMRYMSFHHFGKKTGNQKRRKNK